MEMRKPPAGLDTAGKPLKVLGVGFHNYADQRIPFVGDVFTSRDNVPLVVARDTSPAGIEKDGRIVVPEGVVLPRIELFARQQFGEWSVWGNQVERGLFNHG